MKILLTLLLLALSVNAASLADLTYTTTDGKVTITDCVTGAAGILIIPTAIEDNPVTGIGSNAFQKCSSLTSVTIPSSVTSIDGSAFAFCTSLTSVTIPSSVTSIGTAPFIGCASLTSIIVEQGNVTYTSLDGVLFNIDQTTLIQYPAGKTGSYTIPDSVTSIGSKAFGNCTSLTSVTIPSSVTSIGSVAFGHCTSLTSVTIPSSVISIGSGTFINCTSLTSVTIPSSVTSIGYRAFDECSSLTSVTIPSSVTSIGYAAFAFCTSLTSVTIPSSVTSIAIAPFGRCTRLTSIIVEKGNVAYTSLDGVLFDIDQTKLIQYPAGKTGAYTIPDSVTSIEAAAFIECTLTSVTIPSSVTSIGNSAFDECSSLISTFFLGDAGTVSRAFSGLDQNHIFYYLDTSTGFTSPTWEGYPTQMINTATYPAAAWLLSSNHSYDTNLVQDINGDGVSLLMAYALKLNPNERLGNRLPKVVFDDANTLSMKYYGGSTGVTYRVESSKDMTAWETTDVTVSDPDSNGVLTASIPKDGACLFLRLVVVED